MPFKQGEIQMNEVHLNYLRSEEWRNVKIEFKSMYKLHFGNPDSCFMCMESREALHHWNYPKDFKDDNWKNLLPVCHECHSEIHDGFHWYAKSVSLDKIEYIIQCLEWYVNKGNRYYRRGYLQGLKDGKK